MAAAAVAGPAIPGRLQPQPEPQPPVPAGGSRCSLLVIVGGECARPGLLRPVLAQLEKGIRSWDVDPGICNLDEQLKIFVSRHSATFSSIVKGQRSLHHRGEELETLVLLNPSDKSLVDELRNLLLEPSYHKLLVLAGPYVEETGELLLQTGGFSPRHFFQILSDKEIEDLLNSASSSALPRLTITCPDFGEWAYPGLDGSGLQDFVQLQLNPPGRRPESEGLREFLEYVAESLEPPSPFDLLEPPATAGFLKISRPCCYVFPGGLGDAAFFAVNGFTVLVNGGSSARSSFWKLVRHLDRVDAVLVTRADSLPGINSLLQRKLAERDEEAAGVASGGGRGSEDWLRHLISPDLGVVFLNTGERRPVWGDDEAGLALGYLARLGIQPTPLCRSQAASEPVVLFLKMGVGRLDMYILHPPRPAAGRESALPSLAASACALLVWHPASPTEKIVRVLFPGCTPQSRLLEGLAKLQHLSFLRQPVVTPQDLEAPGPGPGRAESKESLRSGSRNSVSEGARPARPDRKDAKPAAARERPRGPEEAARPTKERGLPAKKEGPRGEPPARREEKKIGRKEEAASRREPRAEAKPKADVPKKDPRAEDKKVGGAPKAPGRRTASAASEPPLSSRPGSVRRSNAQPASKGTDKSHVRAAPKDPGAPKPGSSRSRDADAALEAEGPSVFRCGEGCPSVAPGSLSPLAKTPPGEHSLDLGLGSTPPLDGLMNHVGEAGEDGGGGGSSEEKTLELMSPASSAAPTPSLAGPRRPPEGAERLALSPFREGGPDVSPTVTTPSLPAEVGSPHSTEVDESLSVSFEQVLPPPAAGDVEAGKVGLSLPLRAPATRAPRSASPHDVDLCLVSPCEFEHPKSALSPAGLPSPRDVSNDSSARSQELARGHRGSGGHPEETPPTSVSESLPTLSDSDPPPTAEDGPSLAPDSDEEDTENYGPARDPLPAPMKDPPPLPAQPGICMVDPETLPSDHLRRREAAGRASSRKAPSRTGPGSGPAKAAPGTGPRPKGPLSHTLSNTRSEPPDRGPRPAADARGSAAGRAVGSGGARTGPRAASGSTLGRAGSCPAPPGPPVYLDLAYLPGGVSARSVDEEFFRRVRALCYVISGHDQGKEEAMRGILDALLAGKECWEADLQVTLIPTFDSLAMHEWYQETHGRQQDLGITVLGSNSTVAMQDETFPACKVEF
ncbi:microtubule-associated protein 1S [Gracilinanus agilis]|uniref:microtubule-associated protein 1S n=1 Tax=Gracilinanus agilis TaxID=191870 RepID=UPI001CFDEFBA|nr:microtubule-associated protein 1S [Gracilinanus agilis]